MGWPRRSVGFLEGKLRWDARGFYLRRRGVDMLHVFEQIYRVPPDFPSLVTYHDSIFTVYPQWYSKDFMGTFDYNARHARHLLAVSECTRRDLIRYYGLPEARVSVMRQAVDHQVYRPIADQQALRAFAAAMSLPSRFLLALGPFAPKKNVDLTLRVFAGLKHGRYPDLALVLAGPPNAYWWDRVRQKVQKMGLKDVCFSQGLDNAGIAMLYNLAEALIFPSWYEGFGLPPIEAMACGCPVAASNTGSIPEMVEDAALLFDPADVEGATRQVEQLIGHGAQRQVFRERGLAQAAKFQWKDAAAAMLAAYRTVERTL
jgi:glycosyltransferase involved in cell wall biosynthesis